MDLLVLPVEKEIKIIDHNPSKLCINVNVFTFEQRFTSLEEIISIKFLISYISYSSSANDHISQEMFQDFQWNHSKMHTKGHKYPKFNLVRNPGNVTYII